MMRKLFLLAVMVVAAFAFSASSASAIVVEGDGDNEITGNGFTIHTLAAGPEITAWKCVNHWQGDIAADGHIGLDDIDIDAGTGTLGNCGPMNDCNDAGWEGQAEEDHPGWEYSAHLTFCLEGQGGPLDGVPVTIECQLANTEMHCGGTHDGVSDANETESFVGNFTVAPGVVLPFFVEGEVAIRDNLGLMHEEA